MKRKIGINADCFRDINDIYPHKDYVYGHIKKLRDYGFEHFFIGELRGGFGKYRDVGESWKRSLQ